MVPRKETNPGAPGTRARCAVKLCELLHNMCCILYLSAIEAKMLRLSAIQIHVYFSTVL